LDEEDEEKEIHGVGFDKKERRNREKEGLKLIMCPFLFPFFFNS